MGFSVTDSLCLSVGVFRPSPFKVIIAVVGSKVTTLLTVFYSLYLFSDLPFVSGFRWLIDHLI